MKGVGGGRKVCKQVRMVYSTWGGRGDAAVGQVEDDEDLHQDPKITPT